MAFTTADPSQGALDILTAFGPLAAMHAALERQGIGLPCSSAAHFPGWRAEQLDQAIGRVAARLSVLNSRLVWRGDQPVLELGGGGPTHLSDPLAFRPDETGVWGYRLSEDQDGVRIVAAWAHAVADGPSMLGFLSALAHELNGEPPPSAAIIARACRRQQSMAAWLPGFLLEHAKAYDGLDPANRAPRVGASFAILPPAAAERLREDSRGPGATARLASAAASCLMEQQRGRSHGEVYLNVPISRGAPAALGGFGFEGSSVRLPLRLSPRLGIETLAALAGKRLRTRIDHGWDLNLLRFLSGPASRRMKFAAVQARRPPDSCLTISWKGWRNDLGARHGVRQVACFAAAPTLHLSGHASEDGLSLSLSTPQASDARRGLLGEICARLGLGRAIEIRELADIV